MKHRREGFQKPIDDGTRREVRVAAIRSFENYMTCSCGAIFKHPRKKARENAAEGHVNKKHGGSAMWF